MRCLIVSSLMLLFSLSSFAVQAQTKAELQAIYMNLLKKKGLKPSVDGDGDVQFAYEDRTYFIGIAEEDPAFFRLVLPNIWPVESELERIEVMAAVNEVNKTLKTAKAYEVNENVWIAVEVFQTKPEAFVEFFDRYLNIIDSGVTTFVEAMQ